MHHILNMHMVHMQPGILSRQTTIKKRHKNNGKYSLNINNNTNS